MIVDSYVKDICKRIEGKKVLDLGCCASTAKNLLKRHNEYKKTAKEIIGVDYNRDLLKLANERGAKNLYELDVTQTQAVNEFILQFGTFDTIVCTDVIEHIANPGLFLENLKKFMSNGSKVYLTTPNARSTRWYAMYVRNQIKINADHVAWHDVFTLTVLLKRHGLKITKTMYHSAEVRDANFLKLNHQDWMARRLYVIIEKA